MVTKTLPVLDLELSEAEQMPITAIFALILATVLIMLHA